MNCLKIYTYITLKITADSKTMIVLKILTAGEGGVGKTTLLHKFVDGTFLQDTRMTIGIQFHVKELDINGTHFSLQLWDFGGQERFRFMMESYVAGAKGALLLFDLTRATTLDKIDQWVSILRKHDKNLPILLVGTKLDLPESNSITEDYIDSIKEEINAVDFIKISSKDHTNVNKAFELISIESYNHTLSLDD